MYPTLFHIPGAIGGWPVLGVGILLGIWVGFSVVLLAWLVRRQGWNVDTRGYLPVLLVGAALIAFVLPRIADNQGLPVRGYGTVVLAAFAAAVWLAVRRARQIALDPEIIYSLAFWLLISGIVGARLFYVVQYWNEFQGASRADSFAAMLNLTQGGLVIYGAVLGGGIGLVAFARSRQLPLLALMDLVAAPLALAMGLGRIGCLLTGCCYGQLSDLPWAIRFPAGSPAFQHQLSHGQLAPEGIHFAGNRDDAPVIASVEAGSAAARARLNTGDRVVTIDGRTARDINQVQHALAEIAAQNRPVILRIARDAVERRWLPRAESAWSLPVHPTQLYALVDGVVISLFLSAYYPFRRRDGAVAAWFFTLYPITRFLIEKLRTDEAPILGTGMTISQNISILILAGAAALWIYLWRQPAGSALPLRPVMT